MDEEMPEQEMQPLQQVQRPVEQQQQEAMQAEAGQIPPLSPEEEAMREVRERVMRSFMYSEQVRRLNNRRSIADNEPKLLISNLAPNVTHEDLRHLFERFEMSKSVIQYDNDKKPMGIAEVMFYEAADAKRAMRRYNLQELKNRPMHIVFTRCADRPPGFHTGVRYDIPPYTSNIPTDKESDTEVDAITENIQSTSLS